MWREATGCGWTGTGRKRLPASPRHWETQSLQEHDTTGPSPDSGTGCFRTSSLARVASPLSLFCWKQPSESLSYSSHCFFYLGITPSLWKRNGWVLRPPPAAHPATGGRKWLRSSTGVQCGLSEDRRRLCAVGEAGAPSASSPVYEGVGLGGLRASVTLATTSPSTQWRQLTKLRAGRFDLDIWPLSYAPSTLL